MSKPTFQELVALEPQLYELYDRALSWQLDTPEQFCPNALWYGFAGVLPSLRNRVISLVAWHSGRDGILGTSEAYDVASQTIRSGLPDCEPGCACSGENPRYTAVTKPMLNRKVNLDTIRHTLERFERIFSHTIYEEFSAAAFWQEVAGDNIESWAEVVTQPGMTPHAVEVWEGPPGTYPLLSDIRRGIAAIRELAGP